MAQPSQRSTAFPAAEVALQVQDKNYGSIQKDGTLEKKSGKSKVQIIAFGACFAIVVIYKVFQFALQDK